jgi:hypothetical protein
MKPAPPSLLRVAVGWTAVGLSTLLSALWAFWGSIENFHEGWYYRELWRNIALALIQYWPWMFIPMTAALVALWRRWAGVAVHIGLAALVIWRFGARGAVLILIAAPLVTLATLYAFGRPEPKRSARAILIGIPLLTALIAGAYPGWRVLTRPTTVDLTARRISANGVDLVWAPAGPGWDTKGFAWYEAVRRCEYLDATGTQLAQAPQRIWRLPTVDEAVRSMSYRGQNAGGMWDASTYSPHYRIMPDKEAPLWNPFSQVIYLWTSDESESDSTLAYRVVYNGLVNTVPKKWGPGYLACRCVRSP